MLNPPYRSPDTLPADTLVGSNPTWATEYFFSGQDFQCTVLHFIIYFISPEDDFHEIFTI